MSLLYLSFRYVFSGMGSQWAGMAKSLMPLEAFKNSIKKCADVLKPRGVNLEDIICNGTETTFDNVLNSFIAIASMQVALTDVLTSLGVVPDGIVGHSVGEVGKWLAFVQTNIIWIIESAYAKTSIKHILKHVMKIFQSLQKFIIADKTRFMEFVQQ